MRKKQERLQCSCTGKVLLCTWANTTAKTTFFTVTESLVQLHFANFLLKSISRCSRHIGSEKQRARHILCLTFLAALLDSSSFSASSSLISARLLSSLPLSRSCPSLCTVHPRVTHTVDQNKQQNLTFLICLARYYWWNSVAGACFTMALSAAQQPSVFNVNDYSIGSGFAWMPLYILAGPVGGI